jgi:plasmid stability protein
MNVSATAPYDRDKGLSMTLTIELPDERQAALAARARAQGVSTEQYARQLLEHALEATGPPAAARPEEQRADPRPIWEVMLDNFNHIPPEAFAKLPKDGASEIDHYLYGHPKRNQ